MKKLFLSILVVLTLMSCDGSTKYGECIGVFDEGNPDLVYKMSIWNGVWSAIFIETIIVPIVWAAEYARCPIAKK